MKNLLIERFSVPINFDKRIWKKEEEEDEEKHELFAFFTHESIGLFSGELNN